MLIDEIRAAYPHPVSSRGCCHFGDQYCVGGAICQYYTRKCESFTPLNFPNIGQVAYVLQKLNPKLAWEVAKAFARSIVHENDYGYIEYAWELAGRALRNEVG